MDTFINFNTITSIRQCTTGAFGFGLFECFSRLEVNLEVGSGELQMIIGELEKLKKHFDGEIQMTSQMKKIIDLHFYFLLTLMFVGSLNDNINQNYMKRRLKLKTTS